MKKALLLLLLISSSYAQELVGKVEYQTIRNESLKNELKSSNEKDELTEDISKAMDRTRANPKTGIA